MHTYSLKQINKSYGSSEQAVHAINNCNLDVKSGEFLVLKGRSGSGKSTLLNILGFLTPPDTGTIEFDGQRIDHSNKQQCDYLRKEKIGFVFQQFNLFPNLTVLENVELPLFLLGQGKKKRKKIAMDTLRSVGVADLHSRFPSQLSGGQQQRVAIARALVKKPSVVIADEPTASLDLETSESLISVIRNLQAETNITFVFSSHDPDLVSAGSRIINVLDGRFSTLEGG